MNRQAQIDAFLLAAHRLAMSRLREDPSRIEAPRSLLTRWRRTSADSRSDPYWNEWERLLTKALPELEAAVCGAGDQATLLRSVSPMGVLITQRERTSLLAQARQA